jgi:hypothetical protein
MIREGIIIDTKRGSHAYREETVPSPPTNTQRYADWVIKSLLTESTFRCAPKNWVWLGKKKPKTFLSKKPKVKKRRMETVAI